MAEKVLIASACRTAIGKFGGSLSEVPAVDLAAIVIGEALNRAKIDRSLVEHVYFGTVLQAGQGQNPARQAAIKAGLPVTATALTVNIVCGSGLESINMAARMIKSGEADIVVAGGAENMSMSPYILAKARTGYRMGNGELTDSMIKDSLWDAFNDYHMGITAENVAEKWNISREAMDAYSANSQSKAAMAQEKGRFLDEIVPVELKSKKGAVMFSEDESIRAGTTEEALSRLRPAFKKDGMVTAGNSSGISDGAAAVVLISEQKAKALGISCLATWEGGALAGVDPAIMGTAPIISTNKLLKKLNMTVEDLDLVEANEAFAAQAIAVVKDLKINPKIVNVNGGAIALGHPVGASGCRILVSLIYEMKKRQVKTGLATLCIGGGMGCSAVVRLL